MNDTLINEIFELLLTTRTVAPHMGDPSTYTITKHSNFQQFHLTILKNEFDLDHMSNGNDIIVLDKQSTVHLNKLKLELQ
ncbi:MAG: hypothetical protein DRG78_00475 [Epsilonproteobacteria bacterium]|nr:MAG: hypothetical protein DRG78_00475 [Campylobacterota bacterium]